MRDVLWSDSAHEENHMTNDAISVAPHAYKVVLETDRVRVLESAWCC